MKPMTQAAVAVGRTRNLFLVVLGTLALGCAAPIDTGGTSGLGDDKADNGGDGLACEIPACPAGVEAIPDAEANFCREGDGPRCKDGLSAYQGCCVSCIRACPDGWVASGEHFQLCAVDVDHRDGDGDGCADHLARVDECCIPGCALEDGYHAAGEHLQFCAVDPPAQ